MRHEGDPAHPARITQNRRIRLCLEGELETKSKLQRSPVLNERPGSGSFWSAACNQGGSGAYRVRVIWRSERFIGEND